MLVNPSSRLKQLWDSAILLLSILAAVEIPIYIVFRPKSSLFFYVMEILYLVFFSVDIFFNFHTAYFESGRLVQDKKLIRRHYLQTWFAIDLIAAIPFEFLYYFRLGDILALPFLNDPYFLRSLYIVKVIRLFRLRQYIKEWQRREILNPSLLRLASLLFWIFIFAHWVALGWLSLGRMKEELSPVENYILALYWTITTLTTVGYGDITPVTLVQYLYAMGIEIAGVAFFGYVIGSISSLLANLDASRTHFREKMEKLSAFMRGRQLPREVQERVRAYYDYLWETRRGSLEQEILSELPRSLRIDVAIALKQELIRKVPLFQGAETAFIRQLVLHLEPTIYLPGDIIFHQGEMGHGMYFIARGCVEIYNEKTKERYAILNEGNFFGELSLLLKAPRNATARCLDYCDLYRLDKTAFDEIIAGFPHFAAELQKRVAERSH
ncbi:MAG: ion transporter [Leptospiraceae bacterium]|nr:ion transporter [Leptospiraceae bacterium]MDW8307028.1 ion transporter [Leptospiraceae bacterium]